MDCISTFIFIPIHPWIAFDSTVSEDIYGYEHMGALAVIALCIPFFRAYIKSAETKQYSMLVRGIFCFIIIIASMPIWSKEMPDMEFAFGIGIYLAIIASTLLVLMGLRE